MYPLSAVLVNSSDSHHDRIRKAIEEHGVTIERHYPDVKSLLSDWPSPPDSTRRLLVMRLGSIEDVQQMARLESCFPGWPLLAFVEGDYDTKALFEVSRAGAAQILPVPAERGEVDAALDRILLQFGLRETPSRVIALSGVVEGCGATSLAINLAAELAALGNVDTILTEMSFAIGRLAAHLNVHATTTTRDLLTETIELNPAAVKSALVKLANHYFVLSGQSRHLDTFVPTPGRLVDLFRILRRLATFVVVDMPYSFDPHYFEVLALVDHIILVSRQDVPSMQAAKLIKHSLIERGLNVSYLVLNFYDSENSAISCDAVKEMLQMEKVLPVQSDPSGFSAASNSGRPLRELLPTSSTVSDLQKIALEILTLTGLHPDLPRSTLWDRIKTLINRLRQ